MRIGEVADKAEVTTKALRYYERVGLLAEPARTASGYRDYSDAVLDRLDFIRASQAAGLTLGEIKEVIAFRDRGDQPCSHVLDLIEGRASDLGPSHHPRRRPGWLRSGAETPQRSARGIGVRCGRDAKGPRESRASTLRPAGQRLVGGAGQAGASLHVEGSRR